MDNNPEISHSSASSLKCGRCGRLASLCKGSCEEFGSAHRNKRMELLEKKEDLIDTLAGQLSNAAFVELLDVLNRSHNCPVLRREKIEFLKMFSYRELLCMHAALIQET